MSTTTEKWTIFGERLKAELDRQGMSLRQFSEKTGITLVTACRYVHSQRTPRATEILKAAKVLGVTCDYMLGLSDDPHKTRDGWAKAGFHELPSAQPEPCEDTISRQDAIRIVDGIDTWQAGWRGDAIESMKALPTAQPETHEERTETHSCDCISRQAAIDIVVFECGKWTGLAKEICKQIKQLPTTQPERKKGKWIRNDNGTYSCSVCQSWIPEEQHCYARYCLYCGADMRGEQDE